MGLSLSALSSSAGIVTAGPLGASPYLDTEVVTNFPCASWRNHLKTFSVTLAFAATPSNNVQMAFGTDVDHDGALSPDEERLVVGWDCGEWFLACPTNGVRAVKSADPDEYEDDLFCSFGMRSSGDLSSVSFRDWDWPLFAAVCESRPGWLYGADWDCVRLTARGAGISGARFSAAASTWGTRIVFR